MQVSSVSESARQPEGEFEESSFLSHVVDAIGKDDFAEHLLDLLNLSFGCDYCGIFQLMKYKLSEIATASIDDSDASLETVLTPYEVKRHLSLGGSTIARVEVQSLSLVGVPRPQQILISLQKPGNAFCVGMVRSQERPSLTPRELNKLRSLADLLMSMVARHADLTASRPQITPALSSLSSIHECLLASSDLSRRESEVCARILFGMSSYGIAVDLGIGKESVMTYRKRAYQRLGIATQRELLMWYLAQWSALDDQQDYAAVN